ncbi:hypothetical protein [Pseudoalteromonas sp. OOF1S-7]|uniref:hypothetical protein n=1 Tax=Pseudoalteromonas sp. OOF1S-7 TaxID=2917757 RepID=UPI001EF73C4B|nr:hypothetical protein [Pseudoalteromonas sp. OOF1S-7]MCG7537888.1 hypothetical protein [Pseudoalteromonas sp. OOF1S-7]
MIQDKLMKVMFAVILVSILGCDSSGENNPPSNDSVRNFYTQNKVHIESFVEFCALQERVRWLGVNDIDLSSKSDANLDDFSVANTRLVMTDLGIESMFCARDYSKINAPLVSVTLPLYNSGLSVSGVSKGIKFIVVESARVKEQINNGELTHLGDTGWYIYYRES